MIVTVLVCVGSFVTGAGITGAAVSSRLHRGAAAVVVIDGLTDADRDVVATDFAVHVSAVRRKVSEFADALADGDADLRDRLRHFEKGGDRS